MGKNYSVLPPWGESKLLYVRFTQQQLPPAEANGGKEDLWVHRPKDAGWSPAWVHVSPSCGVSAKSRGLQLAREGVRDVRSEPEREPALLVAASHGFIFCWFSETPNKNCLGGKKGGIEN